jgi:hypothetical protein
MYMLCLCTTGVLPTCAEKKEFVENDEADCYKTLEWMEL